MPTMNHFQVKAVAACSTLDSKILLSSRQVMKELFDHDFVSQQCRWDQSGDVRFFPENQHSVAQGDFYVNQVLIGQIALGDHEARFFSFFRSNPAWFCLLGNSTDRQCIDARRLRKFITDSYFHRDFHVRTRTDLCLDHYSRKGIVAIISELLRRLLDLVGCLERI